MPKKLGIHEGTRFAVVRAPPGFAKILGTLPKGAVMATQPDETVEVAIYFAKDRRELEERFEAIAARLSPTSALWICWPKKTSGVKTDVDEKVVRATGLAEGWVDVKVCAIDETWSGLKFVVRLENRPR